MSHLISVQLDALAGLLEELAVLGRQLGGEAQLSSATGRSLETALSGAAGAAAGEAGAEWSAVLTALAARTLAVAATLDQALAAYRAADAGITQRIGAAPRGRAAVAR